VVEESHSDLTGAGVNIAARLEGVCETGGIRLSERAAVLEGARAFDPKAGALLLLGVNRRLALTHF
jgi:class 3 adenylate cyclase